MPLAPHFFLLLAFPVAPLPEDGWLLLALPDFEFDLELLSLATVLRLPEVDRFPGLLALGDAEERGLPPETGAEGRTWFSDSRSERADEPGLLRDTGSSSISSLLMRSFAGVRPERV